MTIRRPVLILVLAAATLMSATFASGQALKLAVVDMDAVSEKYNELNDEQTKLQAWVKERRDLLTAMQDFLYVSAEEFQEVGRVYQVPKAQWTEAQKKREEELRGISSANERKFLDLQAMPARTAEQQNAYGQLRDTATARDRDIRAISQAFDAELRQKREEVQGKLSGNVKSVIEKVGKEQGFNAVFDKAIVFYFTAELKDITEDVLKALNAGAAAAAPAPAPAPETPAPAPAPAPAPPPAPAP